MSITLPNEIWALVLAPLPLRALLSASLVSRPWQKIAFPYLYQSVSFTRPQHLERLARRVTSDHGAALSVQTHIRALSITERNGSWEDDPDGEDSIKEQDLRHLITILSAVAARLEKFSWDLPFLPRSLELIQFLQNSCPNLRSFHFTVSEDTKKFKGGGSRTAGIMISADNAVLDEFTRCV
jgi:hypothetical protein